MRQSKLNTYAIVLLNRKAPIGGGGCLRREKDVVRESLPSFILDKKFKTSNEVRLKITLPIIMGCLSINY